MAYMSANDITLSEYIMHLDTKVMHLVIENSKILERVDFHCEDKDTPVEFQDKPITTERILYFLADRLVPPTQQNIDELLAGMGLKFYDVSAMLRKTHGVLYDDFYWIRFDDEVINFVDVAVRTPEGYKTPHLNIQESTNLF